MIAIGVHPGKTPLFTAEERTAMLHENCAPFAHEAKCELSCVTFSNLVVDAARKAGATMWFFTSTHLTSFRCRR